MNPRIDRRDFALQVSAAIGGLAAIGGGPLIAQDRDPAEKRLVLLGLNALARSPQMNYFNDGHRGAAMISAYLLCVDNNLDDQATARIVELFDLNWANSKLCQPFPEGDPDPDGIEKIGAALVEGSEALRQVGHNAIFAMLAIKGFRMMPEAATPERVLDTRRSGMVSAGAVTSFSIPSPSLPNGFSRTAQAASINLTAARQATRGYVTAWDCGPRPETSALNPAAAQSTANGALVSLSPSGDGCLFHASGGHLIVDLAGWWI